MTKTTHKIGIVTFHNAENYGAILQCTALKNVIRHFGYQCEVVDYHNHAIEYDYKLKLSSLVAGGKKHPIETILRMPLKVLHLYTQRIRKRKFQNDIKNLCYPQPLDEIAPDILVFGSDQIWNPLLTGHDTFYLGDIETNTTIRKIAYAASLGFGNPCFLKSNKHLLCNFDAISVRESSLVETLSDVQIHADVTLDPTLLLNKEQWDSILSIPSESNRKPYVFAYGIRDKKATESSARRLADSLGLELVTACSFATFTIGEILNTSGGYATVSQFVELIRNAAVVVTDSFHGTAFSVIYEKPFYSLKYGNTGDSRAHSLLSQLNLLECFVPINHAFNKIPAVKNYSSEFNALRDNSLSFLKNSLS